MTCDHTRWVPGTPYFCDMEGEWMTSEPRQEFTYEDISVGAFRCTQCGHIGYYTGHWKNYYENGIPCSGSDGVSRKIKDIPARKEIPTPSTEEQIADILKSVNRVGVTHSLFTQLGFTNADPKIKSLALERHHQAVQDVTDKLNALVKSLKK